MSKPLLQPKWGIPKIRRKKLSSQIEIIFLGFRPLWSQVDF